MDYLDEKFQKCKNKVFEQKDFEEGKKKCIRTHEYDLCFSDCILSFQNKQRKNGEGYSFCLRQC
jgi:hypothetical protein